MGKIIVTGSSGFIGSNLIRLLDELGFDNILGVDSTYWSYNEYNLGHFGENSYDSMTIEAFTLKLLTSSEFNFETDFFDDVDAIFHLGALVDTSSKDRKIFDYNLSFSKLLYTVCGIRGIPLLYASSAATYGNSENFKEDNLDLTPLNLYAESKLLFDNYVDSVGMINKCFGFKFFNVYGPNEFHKGKMASAVTQIYTKARVNKKITLFKSIDSRFTDGYQARDFIHVDDVITTLIEFYMKRNDISNGLYNVGLGKAITFIDIANEAVEAVNNGSEIEFIDTPDSIKKSYQSFTQADMSKTNKQITFVKHSTIHDYYEYLNTLDDETLQKFYETISF